jgi:hypothetical protein
MGDAHLIRIALTVILSECEGSPSMTQMMRSGDPRWGSKVFL